MFALQVGAVKDEAKVAQVEAYARRFTFNEFLPLRPAFGRVDANDDQQSPRFELMQQEACGRQVEVGHHRHVDGEVVNHFAPLYVDILRMPTSGLEEM